MIGTHRTQHQAFRVQSRNGPWPLALVALAALGLSALPGRAGVQFENCVSGPGGAITCDTRPTGNTLMNDVDARYGLLQQASPGWSEFDPYAGYNDDFGGNDT